MIWKGDTPKGTEYRMACREGTSDENICRLISNSDEYGLAPFTFSGVAIDIGAHIGSVTVPLLIDNPGLTVVAIEPVVENQVVLRRNITLNGLDKRATVLPIAAGADGTLPISHGWKGRHRHIGNLNDGSRAEHVDEIVSMSLSAIYEGLGVKMIALLKLDCEGCEWQVLRDPAIQMCEMIVGEFHWDSSSGGADQAQDILGDSHRVMFSEWNFHAVLK